MSRGAQGECRVRSVDEEVGSQVILDWEKRAGQTGDRRVSEDVTGREARSSSRGGSDGEGGGGDTGCVSFASLREIPNRCLALPEGTGVRPGSRALLSAQSKRMGLRRHSHYFAIPGRSCGGVIAQPARLVARDGRFRATRVLSSYDFPWVVRDSVSEWPPPLTP